MNRRNFAHHIRWFVEYEMIISQYVSHINQLFVLSIFLTISLVMISKF